MTVTYRELAERAGRLAGLLAARGAGPETVEAVMMDRSAELMAALRAVLKAGAAYLPVDPGYPAERLGYMLADARPAVRAGRGQDAGRASGGRRWSTAWRYRRGRAPADRPAGCRRRAVRRGDPAYVIYTSGSTGTPKGVTVTQGAMVNFLAAVGRWFPLGAADRMLAVTTVSFDIHVLELYLPLLAGASVVMADRDTVRDPALLAGLMRRAGATIMQATPALWQAVLPGHERALAGLRVLVGGEALPPALAGQLRSAAAEVTNLYGPTEVTVWATAARGRRRARGPMPAAGADRRPDRQYPGLRAGPVAVPGPGGGGRGAVHRRSGAGARLSGASRADRRAVHRVPVRVRRGADVPDRGPGAVGGGRTADVRRAGR